MGVPVIPFGLTNEITRIRKSGHPLFIYQHGVPAHVVDV